MSNYLKNNKDGLYIALKNGDKKLPITLQTLTKLPVELQKIADKDISRDEAFNEILQYVQQIAEKDYPSAEDRWLAYQVFVKMVARGQRKGLIAYGLGGVGKTFTVQLLLKLLNLREYDFEDPERRYDYDYVKFTGKITPAAFYSVLWEYKNKLLLFDDTDFILKDDTIKDWLKGALDSTGDGTICYNTSAPLKDRFGIEIPSRFKFKGRAIFISNLEKSQFNQAFKTRCLTIDLTMTKEETVQRLDEIVLDMPFENSEGTKINVSPDTRLLALNYIKKNIDRVDIRELNARTLGSIALIIEELKGQTVIKWEKIAYNLIS